MAKKERQKKMRVVMPLPSVSIGDLVEINNGTTTVLVTDILCCYDIKDDTWNYYYEFNGVKGDWKKITQKTKLRL